MTSTLKRFKVRALARPDVKKAYDNLAEEFAFLDEVLKARSGSGFTPRASARLSRPLHVWSQPNRSTLPRSPRFKSMRRPLATR